MKTLNGEHYETSRKESAARVQASRATARWADQQDLRVQNLRRAYWDLLCMSEEGVQRLAFCVALGGNNCFEKPDPGMPMPRSQHRTPNS